MAVKSILSDFYFILMATTLRPIQYERMGYALQEYCKQLGAYEVPLVKEKILTDKVMDEETFEQAFGELKKYVSLIRFSGKRLAMTSPTIDEVWHQFILFTREYHSFCETFYGEYLHHSPNVPSRPASRSDLENLVTEYTETYGPIPEIWNLGVRK